MTFISVERAEREAKQRLAKLNPPASEMTLRDYFAAKAMQSLICAPNVRPMITDGEVSGWAYKMADAMLKERSK